MIKVQVSKTSGVWENYLETYDSSTVISLAQLPTETTCIRVSEDEDRYVRVSEGFILLETIHTHKKGEPVYFKQWTDIGPDCTIEFEKAFRFTSTHEAKQSAAYAHSLTHFEIWTADESYIWNALTHPESEYLT